MAACSFAYDPGAGQRNGIVTVRLTLSANDETVKFAQPGRGAQYAMSPRPNRSPALQRGVSVSSRPSSCCFSACSPPSWPMSSLGHPFGRRRGTSSVSGPIRRLAAVQNGGLYRVLDPTNAAAATGPTTALPTCLPPPRFPDWGCGLGELRGVGILYRRQQVDSHLPDPRPPPRFPVGRADRRAGIEVTTEKCRDTASTVSIRVLI